MGCGVVLRRGEGGRRGERLGRGRGCGKAVAGEGARGGEGLHAAAEASERIVDEASFIEGLSRHL